MHREGQGQLPTMTHWEEVRGPAGPGVPSRGEVFHPRVGIGVVNKKILRLHERFIKTMSS